MNTPRQILMYEALDLKAVSKLQRRGVRYLHLAICHSSWLRSAHEKLVKELFVMTGSNKAVETTWGSLRWRV